MAGIISLSSNVISNKQLIKKKCGAVSLCSVIRIRKINRGKIMTAQQNISLVRKLFDEIYTKNNITLADQIFSENVKLNDPAAPNFKKGLMGLKEREAMYKTAFPDKKLTIDDIVGTEDSVCVRWTFQGTHKGDLQGIPATGKSIKIVGISLYRISNGKISEINQVWDRLSLLEQIGEIEPALALHR
jgi:steroid delta-isomerase-like uncharacterized protein